MEQYLEVSIPAWGDFLFLARTAVGAVATQVGMTVEEIEDLHLAVDELCLSLIGPSESAAGRIELRASWTEDAVEVRCRLDEPGGDATKALGFPDEISERILDALVDEHGIATEGATRVGRLRKRRARTTGG